MTDRQTLIETLRQALDGEDYTPLERLMADLTPEQAELKPDHSPYSLRTVVWHTWFWANAWVVLIRGDGDPFGGHDPDATWPDDPPEAWPVLRERLRDTLRQARALAETGDLERATWQDETVGKNLIQIAVHTAYHVGQVALLRQALGLWPPAGSRA